MTVFCTYCSANKNDAQNKLPAIERYQSARITSVYNAAVSLGVNFLILSGKYGILKPDDQIHYYDHLLKSSKVKGHSLRVAEQLTILGIKDIIFFSKSALEDENINCYINCMELASKKSGVDIKFVYL